MLSSVMTATEALPSVLHGFGRQWHYIDTLDLTQIKRKLALAQPEGSGMSAEDAETAVAWYRRFLKICAKYPTNRTVPNYMIDAVWHTHILDTRAYAADCHRIFGHTLHHYPYFGMNGDAAARDECFDKTDSLFVQEFGESCKILGGQGVMCDGGAPGPYPPSFRHGAQMCDGGAPGP